MYYSPNCQYFYIFLLLIGLSLLCITIIDGFKVAASDYFMAVEGIFNLLISIDLIFRIRMVGFKKYLRDNWWNKLEVFIVVGCNILFIFSVIKHITYEELSEELLLVVWSIAQSLRMIMIARKQRLAIRSAKNLIDFTNLGNDTEVMDVSGGKIKIVAEDQEEVILEDH